ncbi:MAG: pyruvate dehydrogenase (acetyl-transferring) E1 component subunit alpha [Verrucomicrobia bacterium]|nr:pyruvate dehydrogenase (acetyl-transferring) E1 component subunit alpha [Verrucomicrobiota bacterium]
MKEDPEFFKVDYDKWVNTLGKESLLKILSQMLLIRNFETRAEAAYLQGKIGGFFHSYVGQEAIQTSLLQVIGTHNWFSTTYRCHALALLLGVTPREIMAELFGKETGNAKGRGGSMHLYHDQMLGGFGIVGGQIPIATGAALSCKYQKKKDQISLCFLGDGAMPQGTFHESLNMASLWNLPCMYVVENNQWSMGTHISRGVANYLHFAEHMAKAYGISYYRLDGMCAISCSAGFTAAYKEMLSTGRPVLIECVGERFRGHSISDPGLYRTKEHLKERMQRDPIQLLKKCMMDHGWLSEEEYKAIDAEKRDIAVDALQFAEESPWPNPITLEEGVFAI